MVLCLSAARYFPPPLSLHSASRFARSVRSCLCRLLTFLNGVANRLSYHLYGIWRDYNKIVFVLVHSIRFVSNGKFYYSTQSVRGNGDTVFHPLIVIMVVTVVVIAVSIRCKHRPKPFENEQPLYSYKSLNNRNQE